MLLPGKRGVGCLGRLPRLRYQRYCCAYRTISSPTRSVLRSRHGKRSCGDAEVPPSEYRDADWLEVAREAAIDAARRPGLLAFMANELGAVYAYVADTGDESFIAHAVLERGGAHALAVARHLDNPRLAPYVFPDPGEVFVAFADWLRGTPPVRVGAKSFSRLQRMAHQWEIALRAHTVRGARGPHTFICRPA
jgi:hypothetical protein